MEFERLINLFQDANAKKIAITKNTKNKKNNNLEIPLEMAAIEGRPNTPAMIAMIKKMNAHFSMTTPYVCCLFLRTS